MHTKLYHLTKSEISENDSASSTVSKSKKRKFKNQEYRLRKRLMKVLFFYLSLALFVTNALKIENQSISIWGVPTSAAQYIPV